jgi:CpeT protein
MKIFNKCFLILVHIIVTTNIINAQEKITSTDIETLKSWMEGSFDSKLQSQNDTDYYEIHLHMKQIWKEKADGFYLYVEQALVTTLDKPYRQRVYHVSKLNDTTIESKVLNFKTNPLKYAGEWKKEMACSNLSIDSLETRSGCSIFLKKNKNGEFYGSTYKNNCESNLRGASYATSNVTINNKQLVSWDQGYDKENKQVWGATKGGYQFVKNKKE